MTVYRWDGDRFVNKRTGEPMQAPERVAMPSVVKDVVYKSPLSLREITSRSQRREEMKRFGVREVDPSEYKPVYRTRKWAERQRGDHDPHAGTPQHIEAGTYQRLSKADLPGRLAKTVQAR